MPQNQDFLEKMALPYFAHCQAQISPPLHCIAWNKIALSGYIDILLMLKKLDPPDSYLRKIRSFYEHYEQVVDSNPLLGNLDTLSRNLSHLDKTNIKAVIVFALKWNNTVKVLEDLCFDLISQQKINTSEQIHESLQNLLFNMQGNSVLPKWNELLEHQQLELANILQMRNLPAAALSKLNYNQQYAAVFQTEQPWLKDFFNNDKELQDQILLLNKHFLRLINLINEKIPDSERRVKANPSKEISAAPTQDYRLELTYYYDGNDESEYQANFFSLLRNFLK